MLAWDAKAVTAPPTLADYYDLKKYPGKRAMRKDPVAVFEAALQADGVRVLTSHKALRCEIVHLPPEGGNPLPSGFGDIHD